MEYITGMEPPSHHLEWLVNIFTVRSSRVNIIAFPGSGKTHVTIYSLGFLIGNKPWLTNLICSVSSNQAEERLGAVRELVEINDRYRNVFPWIRIDKKSADSIGRPNNTTTLNIWSNRIPRDNSGRIKPDSMEVDYAGWRSYVSRHGDPKDNTLFAAGVTSKSVIGKRVTGFLIVDDPHDEENSATEDQRAKVAMMFKRTLLTRLVPKPDAKAIVISTRWAETDLAGRLMEETRTNGDRVWTTTVTPIEDDELNPTWPEVWSKERVDERADEQGGRESPMYQLSYKNNPQGRASGEVTLDMLRRGLPNPLPEFESIWITTDFAHTEGLRSDWTVYTALARDKEKPFNVYLLDMRRFKKSQISDKVRELGKFCDEIFDLHGMLNGVLMEDKDSKAEEQAFLEARPDIPIKVLKTKGNKEDRFGSVSNRMQLGRFYSNQSFSHWGAFVGEVLSFPGAAHDDIVDTLSLVFQHPDWQAKSKIKAKAGVIRSPLIL